MKITISDIANAFLIFGLCAASACFVELLEGGYDAQHDSLAAHRGDMAANMYYAGDVVARWATAPQRAEAKPMQERCTALHACLTDFTDETQAMLNKLARHVGRAP